MSIVYCILFVCIGFACGVPINKETNDERLTENSNEECFKKVSDDFFREAELLRSRYPAEGSSYASYYNDKIFSPSIYSDINDIPGSSYFNFEDGRKTLDNVYIDFYKDTPVHEETYIQPWKDSNEVSYDEPTKVLMDIEMNNYDTDDDLLPNPVLPLYSAPKTDSIVIHDSIPSLQDRVVHNIDVLKPENTEYLQGNIRDSRSKTDDDFMTELAHQAMLNNILPTIPYLRGSENFQSYPNELPLSSLKSSCRIPIFIPCNADYNSALWSGLFPEHAKQEPVVIPHRGDIGVDIETPVSN